jgi:ABC-type branched-subunit amino acid transport system substrate-binding protein
MRAQHPGLVRRIVTRMAVAPALLALVAMAACGETADPGLERLAPPRDQVRLYGSDGNMLNSVGDRIQDNPNALNGMKGTAPLTRLTETFKQRLRTVDPKLNDYVYAGESYDAVVISALAAEAAHSTAPAAIAAQINAITVGGTECETPRSCFDLIHAGRDIAYRGISLQRGGFTDAGEPSATTYGILRFRDGNRLADSETEFVPTGDGSTATKTPPPPAGQAPIDTEPLKIGGLLPHTGDGAAGGPPMFAGAQLGVEEINDAGGVLGRRVVWIDGDDGTSEEVALATTQHLIGEGAQVIIGTGQSSLTMAVLPIVVAAGRVLFSPANTADDLSTVDDKGLFFRTAPPDVLQSIALADLIMRDGVRRLYIVARDDAYGRGLMEGVRANLIGAGVASADVMTWTYKPEEPNFSVLRGSVKAFAPDGVLVIGFDESADAIVTIESSGLTSRTL